jgi:hypothetical protein
MDPQIVSALAAWAAAGVALTGAGFQFFTLKNNKVTVTNEQRIDQSAVRTNVLDKLFDVFEALQLFADFALIRRSTVRSHQ